MWNSYQEHLGQLYLDMVYEAVVRKITEDECYLLAFPGLPWRVWFATWCVHALWHEKVVFFKPQWMWSKDVALGERKYLDV